MNVLSELKVCAGAAAYFLGATARSAASLAYTVAAATPPIVKLAVGGAVAMGAASHVGKKVLGK
jgi:hypothetical protein